MTLANVNKINTYRIKSQLVHLHHILSGNKNKSINKVHHQIQMYSAMPSHPVINLPTVSCTATVADDAHLPSPVPGGPEGRGRAAGPRSLTPRP